MIRTGKRMRICVTLLICNLIFIWGNSLLPGEVSAQLSNWVKDILSVFLTDPGVDSTGGGLLRKLAHFTEFTALGALLCWLFAMLGKGKHVSFLWGLAAACIDESIQMFIPGRGPGIRDVLIDSCGVAFGMVLLCLGHSWYRKYRNIHLEEISL